MSQAITIQSEGRRHYILNTPYAMREKLRSAGCKWDPARKAWWTGKAEIAAQFANQESSDGSTSDDRKGPGADGIVAARATYKGKTYYVAGRIDRGRTRYDDRVSTVTSRDGSRVLLYFRDGSSQFWAARGDVQITKSYDRPQTIGRLTRYAEEARQARTQGYSDGIPEGRRYECQECGEYVTRGQGTCWETGCAH